MATERSVTELIQSALRVIGVLAPGKTASAADMATALDALQDMLAEWGDGGLAVPAITTEAISAGNHWHDSLCGTVVEGQQ